jgi:hypothetical protein
MVCKVWPRNSVPRGTEGRCRRRAEATRHSHPGWPPTRRTPGSSDTERAHFQVLPSTSLRRRGARPTGGPQGAGARIPPDSGPPVVANRTLCTGRASVQATPRPSPDEGLGARLILTRRAARSSSSSRDPDVRQIPKENGDEAVDERRGSGGVRERLSGYDLHGSRAWRAASHPNRRTAIDPDEVGLDRRVARATPEDLAAVGGPFRVNNRPSSPGWSRGQASERTLI